MISQPLICTLRLDQAAQDFYEHLRERFFPPERNFIAAHLTLFHSLPDEEFTYAKIAKAASASAVLPLTNPTLRSIGRGCAIFFRSEALNGLHATLTADFGADLIPQDRQRFQPHIVVQNKVRPETARQTLAELDAASLLSPQATGLTLWRYLGGPWEHVQDFPFAPGGGVT